VSSKRPVRGQLSTHAAASRALVAASILSPLDPRPLYICALPPGCLPRCLRRPAAAEYVGVGVTLFDTMVRDGRMPKPIRVNACAVWDRLQPDEAVTLLRDEAENSARDTWADFIT
jgi:predicted DNA-binding transcriptional regulator AlpA